MIVYLVCIRRNSYHADESPALIILENDTAALTLGRLFPTGPRPELLRYVHTPWYRFRQRFRVLL